MMMALLALWGAAFLAATPLPMNSEIPFLALQAADYNPWLLVAVAAPANVLGSCVTYGFGLWAERFRDRSWFPLKGEAMDRAQARFNRWGIWGLLLSWAPGGDVLVALAGLMRVPLRMFLPLVAVAKTARYLALAAAGSGIAGLFGA